MCYNGYGCIKALFGIKKSKNNVAEKMKEIEILLEILVMINSVYTKFYLFTIVGQG